MARQKIKIAFIENKNERKACYKKRKKSIFKKAEELSVLCDVDVSVIVRNPFVETLETWPASKDQFDKVVQRYVNLTPWETNNTLNPKEYIQKELEKSEKRLKRYKKIHTLEEFDEVMLDACFVEEEEGKLIQMINNKAYLHDLKLALKVKVDVVSKRIEEMTKNQVHPPTPPPGLSENVNPCVLLAQDKGKGIQVVNPAPPPDMLQQNQNQNQSLQPPLSEMPYVNPQQMMGQNQYQPQLEMPLYNVAANHVVQQQNQNLPASEMMPYVSNPGMMQQNQNQNLPPMYNVAGHVVQQQNQNVPAFAYDGQRGYTGNNFGNGNQMMQQQQQQNGGLMPSMFNTDFDEGPSSSHFP